MSFNSLSKLGPLSCLDLCPGGIISDRPITNIDGDSQSRKRGGGIGIENDVEMMIAVGGRDGLGLLSVQLHLGQDNPIVDDHHLLSKRNQDSSSPLSTSIDDRSLLFLRSSPSSSSPASPTITTDTTTTNYPEKCTVHCVASVKLSSPLLSITDLQWQTEELILTASTSGAIVFWHVAPSGGINMSTALNSPPLIGNIGAYYSAGQNTPSPSSVVGSHLLMGNLTSSPMLTHPYPSSGFPPLLSDSKIHSIFASPSTMSWASVASFASAHHHASRTISKTSTLSNHHSRAVHRIRSCPTAPLFISASQDGLCKVFDIRSQEAIIILEPKSDGVRDVVWNPKREYYVANAFENGSVQVWDIRKPNACVRKWAAHNGPALCVDWSGDGVSILSGGRDRLVKSWDPITHSTASRKPKSVLQMTAPVSKCLFLPHNNPRGGVVEEECILAGFLSSETAVLQYRMMRPHVPYLAYTEHTEAVTALCFDASSGMLMTCGRDGMFYARKVGFPTSVDAMGDGEDVASKYLPSCAIAYDPHSAAFLTALPDDAGTSSIEPFLFPVWEENINGNLGNDDVDIEDERGSDPTSYAWHVCARKYALSGDPVLGIQKNKRLSNSLRLYSMAHVWDCLEHWISVIPPGNKASGLTMAEDQLLPNRRTSETDMNIHAPSYIIPSRFHSLLGRILESLEGFAHVQMCVTISLLLKDVPPFRRFTNESLVNDTQTPSSSDFVRSASFQSSVRDFDLIFGGGSSDSHLLSEWCPPSPERLESWCFAYSNCLHRSRLYTTATLVVKEATLAASMYGSCGPGVSECNAGLTMAVVASSEAGKSHLHPIQDQPNLSADPSVILCEFCHLQVITLATWCQGCGHGGHSGCVSSWFTKDRMKQCFTGCGHECIPDSSCLQRTRS